jgi:hypothetical protein
VACSAVAADRWNYLLNPEHALAGLVEIKAVIEEKFDRRLLRFG